MTYVFKLKNPTAWGFVKASTIREAVSNAAYLWRRAEHKRDVLHLAEVEAEGVCQYILWSEPGGVTVYFKAAELALP